MTCLKQRAERDGTITVTRKMAKERRKAVGAGLQLRLLRAGELGRGHWAKLKEKKLEMQTEAWGGNDRHL